MVPPEDNRPTQQLAAYLTIPLLLAASPIVGWFVGRGLDRWLATSPYCTLLFLLLGCIAGIRETYRIIKRFGNEDRF